MSHRTIALALALALVLVPAAVGQEPPVVDDSWESLFDGRSMAAWEVLWPEYWKVEDGAIHGQLPAEVTWDPPKVPGYLTDFNFIRTKENLPSHHLSFHVKVGHGKLGIGHWGTMKKSLADSFFYGHDGWNEVLMTWQGGTVLLWFNGTRHDWSREARPGENKGKIYFYMLPDAEWWIRDIKIKRLAPAGPPRAGGGGNRRVDPPAGDEGGDGGALVADGLDGWDARGNWTVESGRLQGVAGGSAIAIRTEKDLDGTDGVLSFEYRADGRGRNLLTVLVDVSADGRRSIRLPLPAPGRGWRKIEIALDGQAIHLSVDGRRIDSGRRSGSGGGVGFSLAAGASVEIRKLEFEPK